MRTGRIRGVGRIAAGLFLAMFTVLFVCAHRIPSASAQTAGELFLEVAPQEGAAAVSAALAAPTVIRTRAVRLNLGALTGGAESLNESLTVALNLFDDAYLFADRDRFERRGDDSYTWFGRVAGSDASWAVLTVEQGVMAATIDAGSRRFRVRFQGDGVHTVEELDEAAFPPEDCAPGPEKAGGQSEDILPAPAAGAPEPNDACGDVIDVLALYTDDVRAHYSEATINAEIQNSVDQANQIYVNSGVNLRIRLVHKAQLDFTEQGNLAVDVASLKNPSDGNGDAAHTLRNTWGADLVTLLLYNGAGYCGRAYDIMNPVSTAWEDKAFCVVAYDCSSSNKSFAHELAHLQGARHDWCVDWTDDSPYSYNHGLTVNGYGRSVMAYSSCCSAGCGRLLYFTNPGITLDGHVWGVPEGSYQAADNRKTLNNTRCTVATFRSTVLNLNLTSPNGGQFWQPGSTHNITWSQSGFPAGSFVRIELYKGGVYQSTIDAATANDGSYSWVIPAGITVGHDYRVRVMWTDSSSVCDESDTNFSIDYFRILVVRPYLHEIWHLGIPEEITWELTGPLGRMFDVVLYKGDRRVRTLTSSTPILGRFQWPIPTGLVPGDDYRIVVISKLRQDVKNSSEFFSLVKPVVTLTEPSLPAMAWEAGTAHNITWTSTKGLGGDVRLELWKAKTFNRVIVDSTPNDGSYSWRIPISQAPGEDYRVKIAWAKDLTVSDTSDNDFAITRPRILVSFPPGIGNGLVINPIAMVFNGYTYPIRWQYTPGVGKAVNIDLFNGRELVRSIARGTANDSLEAWTVPADLPPGTGYRIRVSSSLWSGINDFSEVFGVAAPYLEVLSPDGGETWIAGSTQRIFWFTPNRRIVPAVASDRILEITDRVRIELRKGGRLYQYITSPLRGTPDTGSFNWTLPFTLPAGKDYSIRIVSLTRPGLEDKSDAPFTISRPGEFVVLSPNGGETLFGGSYADIRWLSDETPLGVSIDLCLGANCSEITGNTPNSGYYSWLVPAVYATNCRIRITSLSNRVLTDMSDADFTISSTLDR